MVPALQLLSLLGLVSIPILLAPVYAQEIIILNETTPCFLNYSASYQLWQNCKLDEDFLDFSMQGYQWVTGGLFPMLVVSLLIGFSYVKYHKAIYPLIIGILLTPMALVLFPEHFITWSLLMGGAVIFILVWYTFIKQTKEY